jgi:hypothetical protein
MIHHHPGYIVAHDVHVTIVEGQPVIVRSGVLAERIAQLLERHGIADIPDTIPDNVIWAAPQPDERLIDWRLPERPE